MGPGREQRRQGDEIGTFGKGVSGGGQVVAGATDDAGRAEEGADGGDGEAVPGEVDSGGADGAGDPGAGGNQQLGGGGGDGVLDGLGQEGQCWIIEVFLPQQNGIDASCHRLGDGGGQVGGEVAIGDQEQAGDLHGIPIHL